MNKEQAFSKQAHYDTSYRRAYPEEMYRFIFSHINRNQTAWNCGTCSGQVAGYQANHFETVFAIYISSSQLKHAVQKI